MTNDLDITLKASCSLKKKILIKVFSNLFFMTLWKARIISVKKLVFRQKHRVILKHTVNQF